MPKKLERLTLKKQADKALREMISSHRFMPGKWINVESLAKELAVSRTPVWQALKDLEKEGLVAHEHGKGIRMVQMTLEMAWDLYAVRGVLEGMAAGLTTETITRGALKRMASILNKQARTVHDRDLKEYSKLDFDFHAIIYESCGNWLLRELLENTKRRSRPFVCNITPVLKPLYQDHKDVVEAFRAKDEAAARKIMKTHNMRMQDQIERTLKRREDRDGTHI